MAWHRELDHFLAVNKLEQGGRVDLAIRALEPHVACEVMGYTGPNTLVLTGDVRNRGAVVMSRISRMQASRRR